MYMYRYSRV